MYKIKIYKKQIICVLCGILLYVFAQAAGGGGRGLEDGKYLRRNSYGEGDTRYEIMVKGLLEDREVPLEVNLQDRAYSRGEAKEAMDFAYDRLCQTILGGNVSLQEVRSDLNLVTGIEGYGIRVQWETNRPEIIDPFGKVENEECREGGEEVYLSAMLSVGEESAVYQIRAVVYPPAMDEKQKVLNEFQKLLEKLDQKQREADVLCLPESFEGKPLVYRERHSSDNGVLLALGPLMAVLLTVKEKSDVAKAKKSREVQMLLDYSEILSKLMVFLGAGITVRKAWETIVADYEKKVDSSGQKRRYAYEEMSRTYYQMETGTAEGQAYYEFGRRCRLIPYRKLGTLLEQNLRTGTKNMKSLLEVEMTSAFEQRKALARRIGEEAGTKLLLPLFLMLGIVMVMIVVPAMLSFQM